MPSKKPYLVRDGTLQVHRFRKKSSQFIASAKHCSIESCARSGSHRVTILGHPCGDFCQSHTKEFVALWDSALGIETAPQNVPNSHCRQGHEYTPENTKRQANGARECMACRRDRARERRERLRVAA